MQLVDHLPPGVERCAVTGHLLAENDGPFLDAAVVLPYIRPHVVLSMSGAVEVGEHVGMVSAEKAVELAAEIERQREQIEELEAKVAEAEQFKINVEYTLNQFGVSIHTKPGPKPKGTVGRPPKK